jgi:hypothetical protein
MCEEFTGPATGRNISSIFGTKQLATLKEACIITSELG